MTLLKVEDDDELTQGSGDDSWLFATGEAGAQRWWAEGVERGLYTRLASWADHELAKTPIETQLHAVIQSIFPRTDHCYRRS